MENERLTDNEFESLWERLEELKRRESSLPKPGMPPSEGGPDRLRGEIESRLGFFPPLLELTGEYDNLLESLWQQQLTGYYDNPLPELFKEKLLARLARYCLSSYFIVTHACMLHQLGMTAGEVRQWLEQPEPTAADMEQALETLSDIPHPVLVWPVDNHAFDKSLFALCTALFLGREESERYAVKLQKVLRDQYYAVLTALLSCARASHIWMEAHPDVGAENHPVVRRHFQELVKKEPQLMGLFQNHKDVARLSRSKTGHESGITECEEHYREVFENAADIIFTHDFNGRFNSINRAVERIAGYTRTEALRMKITDIIAPEYAFLARKLTDPQTAGEIPINCELEIIARDGNRVVLGISTRPIFRGGKAIAVQGIARDITRSKKTEAELHEANQKLEIWVGELEQRTHEMTLLNEMGDILRACLTTEEAYDVIVRVAQQIFPIKVGALYVIGTQRNIVESAAVWGDQELTEHSFSPQDCWALRRGRAHWVENNRSGLICRHVHHPSEDGYLCIPMMAQGEALGVLHLMQPDKVKMTESKQRLAVTMSEHIAMALSNLRLHETLRSQSIRDPLTGLFNRRFMEESLELEIRRASRNQRPLGMIMIDLDHFKYFNDNFGHEAGDLLLKELGTLLRGNIRGEDIACRYGGEEFTLILPEGTREVTRQRAEFYKEAIQQLDVHYRGHPLGRITASMGVAVFPEHGRTGKALIEAADKALYRSKNAGRDRVTMDD
ncbi:MAG TPA: diguanylate cyclase [Acidobacteriota bacterium]|nr:diguanylate cyclase [Acidobacteriota bacterium]